MSHELFPRGMDKDKQIVPEVIKGTKYFNFSNRFLPEVLHNFPTRDDLSKITILPDFSPVRGPLPTGCCVEIKEGVNWRKYVLSDIGCGITLAKSEINWDKFNSNLQLWDRVADKLRAKKGKKGDLGSGNHFLDAVVDADQNVYFVVHTGSRNESLGIADLINSPARFDSEYERVSDWGTDNRMTVLKTVEGVYGKLNVVLDKRHNFYLRNEDSGKILIYKGAIRLESGEIGIVPSSMDGPMLIIRGKEALDNIGNAMCHGTGRVKSRGESKTDVQNYDINALRRRIYVPPSIKDSSILLEAPTCYRKIEEIESFIARFAEVESVLTPIAYMGQL